MDIKKQRYPSAPQDVIGPLDLLGVKNSIILLELDDPDDESVLNKIIGDKSCIIFCPCVPSQSLTIRASAWVNTDSITKVSKAIRDHIKGIDLIVIHRIDMFNENLSRRDRGALVLGTIQLLSSERTLHGANLLITSGKPEYSIRKIADIKQ